MNFLVLILIIFVICLLDEFLLMLIDRIDLCLDVILFLVKIIDWRFFLILSFLSVMWFWLIKNVVFLIIKLLYGVMFFVCSFMMFLMMILFFFKSLWFLLCKMFVTFVCSFRALRLINDFCFLLLFMYFMMMMMYIVRSIVVLFV